MHVGVRNHKLKITFKYKLLKFFVSLKTKVTKLEFKIKLLIDLIVSKQTKKEVFFKFFFFKSRDFTYFRL